MLAQLSRYAGVFVAAGWLAAGALAAPVRLSDDADFPSFSPASPSVTERIDASSPPVPESVPTQTPQASKPSYDEDVLDIAGGPADTARSANLNVQTFITPIVDNRESIPVQVAARVSPVPEKSQDVAASAAQAAQPSSDLIAHRQSSPLVIATPEPGSVGLLVIAFTAFLARRRSSPGRPR